VVLWWMKLNVEGGKAGGKEGRGVLSAPESLTKLSGFYARLLCYDAFGLARK
jgi:hypothetical protein